jgi:hypothetical protein
MISHKTQIINILFIASYLLVLSGAICFILGYHWSIYIFSVGAVILTVVRFLATQPSDNFRMRRLNRMQAISSILLIATIYLMYKDFTSWGLTLTVAAVIDLVIAFRKPS